MQGLWIYFSIPEMPFWLGGDGCRGLDSGAVDILRDRGGKCWFEHRGGEMFVAGAVEYLATGGDSCESDMRVALTLY